MTQSGWLDRGPCPNPECDTEYGNVQHQAGYSYCFSCETRFGDNILSMPKQEVKSMTTTGNWGALSDRKISMENVL
jgi:hypothetical protein